MAVAGHEQTTRKKAPLIPTTVTATVLVPRELLSSALGTAKPDPGDEPKKPDEIARPFETEIAATITNTVLRTLPPPESDETAADRVKVSSYEDLPAPAFEPPTLAATAQAWFADNWQNLGLIGVGLFSLLILRSMVRSNLPAAPAPRVSMPAAPRTEESADAGV